MPSTGSNSSAVSSDAAGDHAEVVVALISGNDVETIGPVITALRDGLARAGGSRTTRLVLADAGSTDGTLEAARDTAGTALIEVQYPSGATIAEPPYHGRRHRAAALRAIFETVVRLDASACAVVDAGLQTVGSDWIDRLVLPLLAGEVDYVSAYYLRHAHEGALTKGLVYPTFRALYGVQLRQPAASEFGCSGRLARHWLDEDLWTGDQASAAIDLRLSVTAVCGGFRAGEASLGTRTTARRGGAADLSTVIAELVGAVFADVEHHVDIWQRVRNSTAVPVFGDAPPMRGDAPLLNVNGLMDSFRLGYRELREIWTWVLPPRTIVELRRLTDAPLERFRFEDRFWAGIIYDFAIGYAFRVMPHDHLLRSLTPLYNGWLASFVLQTDNASPEDVGARIETLCGAFEAEKRHLISRWRWPERLR